MSSVLYTWLFEVGTNYWSTEAVTYDGNNYVEKVLPDSFSGIELQFNLGSLTLVSSNTCVFSILDNAGTYFTGEDVVVRLLADGTLKRSWKFKAKRVVDLYKKITFDCVDILKDKLVGSWPNTEQPRDAYPSDDPDHTDNYCVPVTLGTAYVPLRSVYTGSARWYLLGVTGVTYDVLEVSSPHDWYNSSTWVKADYTFTQGDQGSYRGVQPEIHDYKGDASDYASGLWKPSDTFLDMPTQFTRSDTIALTSPAEWIDYVLKAWGVDSGDIDITNYADRSISFNGGWWEKASRESVLAKLLAQWDGYLTLTEKIEIHPFSKTSVEIFTDCLEGTFQSNLLTVQDSDGGSVLWQNSGYPQDVLTGQAEVGTYDAQTTVSSPYSTAFRASFISSSTNAQRAALLNFQKRFEQKSRISFSIAGPSITSLATISPGQVLTVNNTDYGLREDFIITKIKINRDLKVDFSCLAMSRLEEWADVTPSSVTIDTGTDRVFPVAPYDIAFSREGTITDSVTVMKFEIPRDVVFPVGLVLSRLSADTAATAQAIFSVKKNGSTFGTFTFAIAGTVATPASTLGATFECGDVITVVGPASADATLEGLYGTIVGER